MKNEGSKRASSLVLSFLFEFWRRNWQRAVRTGLARRLLLGRGLRGEIARDEASGPEGDIAHEGDDERHEVEREEVHLRAREEAVEALGELDRAVHGTDLEIKNEGGLS